MSRNAVWIIGKACQTSIIIVKLEIAMNNFDKNTLKIKEMEKYGIGERDCNKII